MEKTAFSVTCDCGAVIPVTASLAGATIACRCGRQVPVPRLSQLRVAHGLAATETNIRDTIGRLIREETLPWGDCCAVTAMPTGDVMLFDVECERGYLKGSASRKWGAVLFMLGFFACFPAAIFMWLIGYDLFKTPAERVGRDIVITVPLLVRTESHGAVRRWPQSRLKNLLRSVPVYERLLAEYPNARVHPR